MGLLCSPTCQAHSCPRAPAPSLRFARSFLPASLLSRLRPHLLTDASPNPAESPPSPPHQLIISSLHSSSHHLRWEYALFHSPVYSVFSQYNETCSSRAIFQTFNDQYPLALISRNGHWPESWNRVQEAPLSYL